MPLHRLSRTALIATTLLLTACAGSHYQPRTLNGKVTLASRADDTVIRLRLLDEAGLGSAAALLGEEIINRPRHQPAPYALRYDGMAIQPDRHYELDVEVFSAGELKERATLPLNAGAQGLPDTQDVRTTPVGK